MSDALLILPGLLTATLIVLAALVVHGGNALAGCVGALRFGRYHR